jgi:putative sigma-54 modulation protein
VQINLSVRHGDLSASTQERIREKVGKLSRLYDRLTAIHVTVDLERKDTADVELRISVEHSDDFVATVSSDSVAGALDQVVHKMEKQLRRHKDRLTDRRTAPHKHLEVTPAGESTEDLDDENEEEAEGE